MKVWNFPFAAAIRQISRIRFNAAERRRYPSQTSSLDNGKIDYTKLRIDQKKQMYFNRLFESYESSKAVPKDKNVKESKPMPIIESNAGNSFR